VGAIVVAIYLFFLYLIITNHALLIMKLILN